MKDNKTNGFLPPKYTPSVSEFMRLDEGSNIIRIASQPLIGYIWWVDEDGNPRAKGEMVKKGDRPVRIKFDQDLPSNVDSAREFWMLKVYDFNTDSVRVLEITQARIIRSLNDLIANEKWGDPRDYNIDIKKDGKGQQTSYSVLPEPKSDLDEEVVEKIDNSRVDLNKYLSGVDRTEDAFEGMDVKKETKDINDPDIPF